MKKKKNTSFFVKLAVFACAAFAVIVMVQLQLTLNEKIDKYNMSYTPMPYYNLRHRPDPH